MRRPDTCADCDASLTAGTAAYWDAEARTATCLECHAKPKVSAVIVEIAPPPEPVDEPVAVVAAPVERGVASASAGRQYERRRENRETNVRERHPHIGGLILALQDSPQSEIAWKKGRVREEKPMRSLDARVPDATIRRALADAGLSVSVHGILCFTQADLPLRGTMEVRSHLLLTARATAKRLNAPKPPPPALRVDVCTPVQVCGLPCSSDMPRHRGRMRRVLVRASAAGGRRHSAQPV